MSFNHFSSGQREKEKKGGGGGSGYRKVALPLSTSSLKYECWTGDYVCTGNAINFVAFEN
jgi:hypothetical protein